LQHQDRGLTPDFTQRIDGFLAQRCVGLDDERWGQRVVGLVSLREGEGAAEDALREHCRGHVAGYKVPKELYVVDEVFRGPNGKADYKLSKRVAEELSAAAS